MVDVVVNSEQAITENVSEPVKLNTMPINTIKPINTISKKNPVSDSVRAGVNFPVGRLRRYLKRQHRNLVSKKSAVYLAGALEYLTSEVLDAAGIEAQELNQKRITPRAIFLGLSKDADLNKLRQTLNIVIPNAGVVPNPNLLKKSKKKNGDVISSDVSSSLSPVSSST